MTDPATPPPIPHKLTPREPTEEMIEAGAMSDGWMPGEFEEDGPTLYPAKIWRAMWDAAPTPQPEATWQGMESAPHAMSVLAARFDSDAGEWVYAVVLSPPCQPFTHWRPLPAPPEQSA